MNFTFENKGFTLIELIVAITISLFIVLLVSYSLKFFVYGWNKSKEVFIVNQKYLFLNSLLTTEYNTIIPMNYNGKIFIKGDKNYFIFITDNSGTVYNGRNEVGYFFNKDEKKLKICFLSVNSSNNIVGEDILKEEGKCIDFDNIENFQLGYKTLESDDEEIEEIDGNVPVEIVANICFKVNNGVIDKKLEISCYE